MPTDPQADTGAVPPKPLWLEGGSLIDAHARDLQAAIRHLLARFETEGTSEQKRQALHDLLVRELKEAHLNALVGGDPQAGSVPDVLDQQVLRDLETRIFYAETGVKALVDAARLYKAEAERLRTLAAAPHGWKYHHEHQSDLIARDGLMCEQHPGAPWPHDDCAGPGMPWLVEGRESVQALAAAPSVPQRIAELAREYCEQFHKGAVSPSTSLMCGAHDWTDDEDHGFSICQHPDCALVRSVSSVPASAEGETK